MAGEHFEMLLDEDKPKEACGVFGIYAPGQDVARITYYGLYALQHRGQESAGIAVGDGEKITCRKGMGLVGEVLTEDTLRMLKGHIALGHVRYSTAAENTIENAQPHNFYYKQGMIALGHNGNLTNYGRCTPIRSTKSRTASSVSANLMFVQ
jgi:amidophosphoribosyltransferase